MKSVLISIQPKWCELIACGKKTVEVRKTKPKLETPFKCYIYETNWDKNTYWKTSHKGKLGKVIGEFVCDRIIDIPYSEDFVKYYHTMPQEDFEATSLNMGYIDKYLTSKNGYGWHISDLVIYDKPRELSEFYAKCSYDKGYSNENCKGCSYYEAVSGCTGWCLTGGYKPITRPFQSWGYVESEDEK